MLKNLFFVLGVKINMDSFSKTLFFLLLPNPLYFSHYLVTFV